VFKTVPDFFLKQERLIVEAKMAKDKDKYKDAQIGDDLIKDVARYQSRDDYDTLVCFIYDPSFLVNNPSGLAADVQSQQSRLATKVLYGPLGGKSESSPAPGLAPALRSGRTVARSGLRMMPTFPPSPLSFRTVGFPQYG
jgi:hypothetical protein